jgi:predicted GNAT family acetyltransferase
MLWPLIESFTGPARLVREHQPYMMLNAAPLIAPDARVRKARVTDLDSYFDASVEMFTQEVGIDPTALGSAPYKARVLESIEQGKSFGLFDDAGRTLFKCDVGSVAHGVAQLQGVWLSPELRGRGLSASLIASAVTLIQESHAPTCALYVNDFNLAAIRSYERVGFAAVGEFATVFL